MNLGCFKEQPTYLHVAKAFEFLVFIMILNKCE